MEMNSQAWEILLQWVIPGVLVLLALSAGFTGLYSLKQLNHVAVAWRKRQQLLFSWVDQPTDALPIVLSQMASRLNVKLTAKQWSEVLSATVKGLSTIAEQVEALVNREAVK